MLLVALLAGEGLTNREAAARPIVSPKTIEYHLANAYRKLGVRSRVGLARRLDGTLGDPWARTGQRRGWDAGHGHGLVH